MVKKIAAGLVSVGLIGGVGAVTYGDDGTATVTIDDHGTKQTVSLPMEIGGKSYRCPDDTEAKISAFDINAGRIKLTLQRVRQQEKVIDKRHPGRTVPKRVAVKYNKLLRRDDVLVDRFNSAVDERNAILRTDCTT